VRQRHDLEKFRELVGEEKFWDIIEDQKTVKEMEVEWRVRSESKPADFVKETTIRAVEGVIAMAHGEMPRYTPLKVFANEVLAEIAAKAGETKANPSVEIMAASTDLYKMLHGTAARMHSKALKGKAP
jgi:hypothetical protein